MRFQLFKSKNKFFLNFMSPLLMVKIYSNYLNHQLMDMLQILIYNIKDLIHW